MDLTSSDTPVSDLPSELWTVGNTKGSVCTRIFLFVFLPQSSASRSLGQGAGQGWSSCGGSVITNPTSIHKDADLIPGPAQWVKDLVLPRAVV